MNFETGIRSIRAQSFTAGISIATSGVLFMNAERPIVGSIMRATAVVGVLGRPKSRLAIHSTPPVSRTPAPTMNSTPTVIIPSFDMPARASLAVRTPVSINTTTPPTRITSGGMAVRASSTKINPTIERVKCAGVITLVSQDAANRPTGFSSSIRLRTSLSELLY